MQSCPAPITRLMTRADGPLVAHLFGARGACGGCWCMHWRVPSGGRDWRALKGEPARRAFLAGIADGSVLGAVAVAGAAPVGWVSYGPRDGFPRFGAARALRRQGPPGVWSIVCFFIPAGWRGRGVAGQLLDQAITDCRARGAAEIEAYPVTPRPGRRAAAADAWTGVPRLFEAAGFTPLPRAPGERPIWVLPGDPGTGSA